MPGRKLVAVAAPHSEIEAHIIASVLRGSGIAAHVEGVNSLVADAGMLHQLFPVRVPSPELELAQEVLHQAREVHGGRRRDPGPIGEERRRLLVEAAIATVYRYIWAGLLVPPMGLVTGPLACDLVRQLRELVEDGPVEWRFGEAAELEDRIETASRWAWGFTFGYGAAAAIGASVCVDLLR